MPSRRSSSLSRSKLRRADSCCCGSSDSHRAAYAGTLRISSSTATGSLRPTRYAMMSSQRWTLLGAMPLTESMDGNPTHDAVCRRIKQRQQAARIDSISYGTVTFRVRSTEDARHPDPEIVVVAERDGRLELEAANGDRAADERCFTAPYPRAYRTAVRQAVSDAEPGDTLRVRDRIEVVDRAKSVQPLERTDAYRSGTEDVRAQRVTRQAPCCHAACDSDPPEIERDG